MANWGDLSWRTRFGGSSKRAFTPYDPTVPTGSYDPGLDSALFAAQRGLGDTEADTATARARAAADYGLGNDAIAQNRDRQLADYTTAETRGTEDHNSAVAALQRQFQILGGRQKEQANAAGVVDGGALLQSAAKRATNEGIARAPIDQSYQRQLADIATGRARTTEDATSALGQNSLAYQRGDDDALSALLRARREGGQFGIDTQTQKLFQATQAGYVAPQRPSNEFVNAAGVPYRTIKVGSKTIRVDQYGRRI